jgi:hypothetical protein
MSGGWSGGGPAPLASKVGVLVAEFKRLVLVPRKPEAR